MPHKSVLLQEVLQVFEGKQIRVFFEGTVGAGGHARALLEAHPEVEIYFACDRDPRALEIARANLAPWEGKIEWVQGAFGDLPFFLKEKGVAAIDGFLIDVGVSSMQLDERERGFSFMGEAPLDMRMDPENPITAAKLVNDLPEAELARIFFEYGEERRSRKIAKAIVEARARRKIRTTKELVAIVHPLGTRGRLHPATLVFQALRIAVNDELGQLKKGLEAAIEVMAPGGRIAAISFHSLEDRIVKNVFRDAKQTCGSLMKKPWVPTKEEMKKNPRSRSAKLRAVEKKG